MSQQDKDRKRSRETLSEEDRRREAVRRARARERRVPEEEMQPKHRKSNLEASKKAAKKKMKKKHKIDWFYVVSGVLGAAIAVLSFLLLFHIQTIQVTGNTYISSKTVQKWVKSDQFSTNSAYVWARNRFTKVEPLPAADQMTVHMKNPWTIQVDVTEKTVVGGLILNNEYIYYDKDGIVMLKGSEVLDGVAMIEGVSVSKATLYEKLPVEDTDMFSNVLEVSNLLNKNKLVPDSMSYTAEEGMTVAFGEVTVKLGTGNYEAKISQVTPILEKLDGQAGTLELQNYDGSQSTISFKKK